jgi:alkylation response protein AidB-like acyl-CoA dehydrogenase
MPLSIDQRVLDHPEERELLALTQEICQRELAPRAAEYEAAATFPESTYRLLGSSGLLALPFPEQFGGTDISTAAYLQVIEELATAWLSVAIGVSVHTLAASPVLWFGTAEQQERWLPRMLSGSTLGAYCLSEPEAGSDAAHMSTRATRVEDQWRIDGRKAWITHGAVADFFALFARTGEAGARGITLFMTEPATTLTPDAPERKMGLWASPTVQLAFDDHRIADNDRIGELGSGFAIAMRALDAGRLGIAACAVGHAQHALDLAVSYSRERKQFGRAILEFQGLRWLLAELQAQIIGARATYLDAARRKDAGMPYTAHASAAKLLATDVAMKVVTEVVQVLGGNGYVSDYDAERLFREAKVLQIVEGTNQIQREILGKHLS